MTDTVSDTGQQLIDAISVKDALRTLDLICQFKEKMKDPAVGAGYVLWISEPANLTKMHSALNNFLEIPPRALAIKRVPMSRTQRALLLVQAMEIAVKKVYNL